MPRLGLEREVEEGVMRMGDAAFTEAIKRFYESRDTELKKQLLSLLMRNLPVPTSVLFR